MRKLLSGIGLVAVLAIAVTQPVRAVPTPVTFWNDVTLVAVTAGRPGPPGLLDVALVQAAVHDAVQAINGDYEPYAFVDSNASGSPQAAVAAAAYGVLAGLYPSQRPGVNGLDAKYNTYVSTNGLGSDPGLIVGANAAAVLLTLYRPLIVLPANTGSTGVGEWRSTPPANAPASFEFLAHTEPFTLLRPSQFRPQPPPPIKSVAYARDYDEVKSLGAVGSTTRTPAQTDHARFWSDNFIAQWPRTVRAIIEAHVPDIGDAARLLALASLSAADAAITAWDSKFHFNFWRPITAIREGDNDGNPRTDGDPAWLSFIATPPYPDYTSGANNLTGAFTKTLELFFGTDDFAFSVTSNAALVIQTTRNFTSFSQAAEEVVDARVLQGIHFRFADEEARAQGSHVAHWVFQKFLRPVRGKR